MALSEQEKQILEFGKKQGKTREEAMYALGRFRQSQRAEEPEPGFIEETAEDITQIGTGTAEQFREEQQAVAESRAAGDSPVSTFFQSLGGGGRLLAGTVGRAAVGAGKALLPQSSEEKVGETVQAGVEATIQPIIESELGQDIAQTYTQFKEENPETARNLEAGLGIVEGLTMAPVTGVAGAGVRAGVRTTARGTRKVGGGVSRSFAKLGDRAPSGLKTAFKKVPSGVREDAVRITAQNINDSLITDKTTITKMEKIARKQGTTEDQILRQLVDEGGIPRVQDEFARFDDIITDFETRQVNLAQGIDELLARQPEVTDISSMRERAESVLRTSPQIGAELDQSIKELDRFFGSLENRFGDQLSAQDVNRIRIQMNQKTGAFKGEKFTQDTEDAIADVARSRLNEISDDGLVKRANSEWGKLQNLKQVANTLNNRKIKVNDLVETLGSWGGTVGASAAGLSIGGPGGLVIAGLASRYGSKSLAQFIRSRKFNPEIKERVIEGVRQDEELVKQLIKQAEEADKAILERKLLPEPAIRQPAAGQRTERNIEVRPARRDTGRDPQTGLFKRVFRSD